MKKFQLIQTTMMCLAMVSMLILFNACKRNTVYIDTDTFDNSTTAQSTIMGQVVTEDGLPMKDAVVKIGINSYTTNKDGIFYFSKITSPKHATLITVSKANYMTGYRTLLITTNQDHYTKIMMIELKNASTFNSITGGMVNVSGGGSISIPSDAIVYKSNGTPFSGTVSVYTKWLDPTANDLNQLMPGDLRAIDGNGNEKILQTFGMMGVEMFDNSGQALQIAPNKTAKLTYPIPASLAPKAPNSIPLWFFDSSTGMWKEEGSASKQGSNYVGDVKHFSFWNCDVPNNYVNLNLTLHDNGGLPLANMLVRITNTTTGLFSSGWTNSAGFVSGFVPDNATLTLQVIAPAPCYTVVYTQSVTTVTSPVSLGIITIPSSGFYTLTGNVLDCFSNPVSNGFVSIVTLGASLLVPTSSTGSFSVSLTLCTGAVTASVTAYDVSSGVNGNSIVVINPGVNNLGNLTACGTINQFIHWTSTIGTVSSNYAVDEPMGFFFGDYNSSAVNTTLAAFDVTGNIQFSFDGLDNATSLHYLTNYIDYGDSLITIPTPIPVNITNYAALPGGYIEGSFNGAVNGTLFTNRMISCTFRVKRN